MEVISIIKLTDVQWENYFQMLKQISHKYYPAGYGYEGTWKEYKQGRLNNITASKGNSYNEYVLFENESPIAIVDRGIYGNREVFGFDASSDEIPDYILRKILEVVYELLLSQNINEALNWSYNERRTRALKRINAAIVEEIILSRILKDEMNPSFYKRIIDNNKSLNNYALKYYNEIPDLMLNYFIKVMNCFSADIDSLNPYDLKTPKFTPQEWKESEKAEKANGTQMGIYILYDKEQIAGLCSIYTDSFRKDVLRHNGGLTAVSKNYRGKGIGKYLKAKMYLKVLEENKDFKFITTDTSTWNKYMFKINEELGFKPYKQGFVFKLTKEFLKNYLEKK